MRRIATLGLVAVLGALCALGVVPGTTAPAAALLGYPCPPGAPSGSTLCSPSGWLTLTGALPAGYAAGGAAVATATATSAGTSAASAAITAGTTVMIGLGTWGAFELLIDSEATDLEASVGVDSGGVVFTGASIGNFSNFVFTGPLSTSVAGPVTLQVDTPCVYTSAPPTVPRVGATWWTSCMGGQTVTSRIRTSTGSLVQNAGLIGYQECGTALGSGQFDFHSPCFGTTSIDVPVGGYLEFLISGVHVGTWYPPGHPSRPVEVPGGLVGSLEAEFVCRSGSGDTSHFVSTPVDGAGLANVSVDMPEFNCPTGETLVYGIIEWVTDAGRQTVYEYEAPEWVQDIPIEWPNCADGSCTVSLWQVLSPTKIVSCGQYAVGCPEWWQDPYKAENYECHYGPYVVQLGMCSVFRKPGSVSPNVTTTTKPDGSIKTGVPNFSEDPADYPSEGTAPDPAVPPWPTPGPIADPVDDGSMACWPTGWGVFNPLNWVYQPVRCALVWAFVPSSDAVAEDFGRGNAALAEHGVLGIIPAAADVPGDIADGFSGGCSGSLVVFELDTSAGDLDAAIPCSPSGMGVVGSQYATFRTLLGAVITLSTAWGVFITVRAYFGGKDS